MQKPIVSAEKTGHFFFFFFFRFAVSYTPAMVSCKNGVFDRGRNY